MKTDILCEIIYAPHQKKQAERCLEKVFFLFREFEKKYSRFKEDNELWQLNHHQSLQVSDELFDLLESAKKFHEQTKGLFDPSILPALEKNGYTGAYSLSKNASSLFSQLTLHKETRTVEKPKDLYIDLGGIGKGYIVDSVARYLSEYFDNFLVDAGGDIYVKGENKKEGYPHWAIDVEHPSQENYSLDILLLKNMGVATSGINRRRWLKNGVSEHHLIDPVTRQSSESDLVSVTVIADTTVSADVLAKTLFLMGSKRGKAFAQKEKIGAIFVDSLGNVTVNEHAERFVWTNEN